MLRRHAELAKRMAAKSTSRFRLGAVLTRRSRVVSCGWNYMEKTRPPTRLTRRVFDPESMCGIHAEVDALRGLSRTDTKRCHLYVARILRSGRLALAKPCDNCQQVLRLFSIKKVFYSSEDGWRSLDLGD